MLHCQPPQQPLLHCSTSLHARPRSCTVSARSCRGAAPPQMWRDARIEQPSRGRASEVGVVPGAPGPDGLQSAGRQERQAQEAGHPRENALPSPRERDLRGTQRRHRRKSGRQRMARGTHTRAPRSWRRTVRWARSARSASCSAESRASGGAAGAARRRMAAPRRRPGRRVTQQRRWGGAQRPRQGQAVFSFFCSLIPLWAVYMSLSGMRLPPCSVLLASLAIGLHCQQLLLVGTRGCAWGRSGSTCISLLWLERCNTLSLSLFLLHISGVCGECARLSLMQCS